MNTDDELKEARALTKAFKNKTAIKHILFIRNDGDVVGLAPETQELLIRALENYVLDLERAS